MTDSLTSMREVYTDAEFRPDLYGNEGTASLAITDGEGNDYYAVNADMDQAAIRTWSPPFMEENVWPLLPLRSDGSLDLSHADVKPAATIAAEVEAYFTRTTATKTKLFAYFGKDDLARIHALYGNNWVTMPRAIPRTFIDLAELADDAGNPQLPEQTTPKHHALNDAHHDREMHHTIKAVLREQSIPTQRALEVVAGAFCRSGWGLSADFDLLDQELAEISEKTIGTIKEREWNNDFPAAAMSHAVTMVSAVRELLGMSNTPTMREHLAWERARKVAESEAYRAGKVVEKVPFVGGPYDGLQVNTECTQSGPHAGPPYYTPMEYKSPTRGQSACQYGRKVSLRKGEPLWFMELTDKFAPPADAEPTIPAVAL